jgi:hypothetical protein
VVGVLLLVMAVLMVVRLRRRHRLLARASKSDLEWDEPWASVGSNARQASGLSSQRSASSGALLQASSRSASSSELAGTGRVATAATVKMNPLYAPVRRDSTARKSHIIAPVSSEITSKASTFPRVKPCPVSREASGPLVIGEADSEDENASNVRPRHRFTLFDKPTNRRISASLLSFPAQPAANVASSLSRKPTQQSSASSGMHTSATVIPAHTRQARRRAPNFAPAHNTTIPLENDRLMVTDPIALFDDLCGPDTNANVLAPVSSPSASPSSSDSEDGVDTCSHLSAESVDHAEPVGDGQGSATQDDDNIKAQERVLSGPMPNSRNGCTENNDEATSASGTQNASDRVPSADSLLTHARGNDGNQRLAALASEVDGDALSQQNLLIDAEDDDRVEAGPPMRVLRIPSDVSGSLVFSASAQGSVCLPARTLSLLLNPTVLEQDESEVVIEDGPASSLPRPASISSKASSSSTGSSPSHAQSLSRLPFPITPSSRQHLLSLSQVARIPIAESTTPELSLESNATQLDAVGAREPVVADVKTHTQALPDSTAPPSDETEGQASVTCPQVSQSLAASMPADPAARDDLESVAFSLSPSVIVANALRSIQNRPPPPPYQFAPSPLTVSNAAGPASSDTTSTVSNPEPPQGKAAASHARSPLSKMSRR